jgi:hypothetical protein
MQITPTVKKEGEITLEDLRQAIEYMFKSKLNKVELDNILYITDTKDYLYFKYGTFTTGLKGFKNIYK